MVKISGTNFTPGHEAPDRGTEKTGKGYTVPETGAGLSVHAAAKNTGLFQSVPGVFKNFLQLAQALGLPQDTLSASILSFARYFSLPLNSGLLAKIRRDSLSPAPEKSVPGEDARSPAVQAKAAAALAAVAAAAKGVELSPRGLEKYALSLSGQEAADCPAEEDRPPAGNGNPGGGNSGGNSGGGEGREQGDGKEPALREKQRRAGKVVNPGDTAGADKFREKILKIEEQDPLLHLLNRFPGKNARRWIVIPFSLAGKTGEFRVSLRLLLHETPSGIFPGRLALDVSGGDKTASPLRWLFVFDKPPEGESRLRIWLWPPEDKRTLNSFQKELSRLFSMSRKHIHLRNCEEFPSFATDCRDDILPSINKEV
ncbi:MAG: hypothetical protein LBG10_00275 [Treponema sp.]|jgi:hypothetical protein|nr:hypothetical protein [Treponema sp.]